MVTAVSGCGSQHATPTTPQPTPPIVNATARQVARAMMQDRFFATYDGTTLRVRGRVSTVRTRGHDTIITLRTGVPAKVLCDVGYRRVSVHPGATVVVESVDPQGDVSRESVGVVISDCGIRSK